MLTFYYKSGNRIARGRNLEDAANVPVEHFIWLDFLQPEEEEKRFIEQKFETELFTKQEREEIESSSKYFEDIDEVNLNINFMVKEEAGYEKEPVSFIISKDVLITQRNRELKTFVDVSRRVIGPGPGATPFEIMLLIMEIRIDYDADLIEAITAEVSSISRSLVTRKDLSGEVLIHINTLQESTILIRENIIEKQRILSSVLKSHFFSREKMEVVRVMIKDVGSLLDHTSFNFERLESLQNTFLGLIDLEQNKVIKIFTVVSIVFMPPTLIASIYGMNFKVMPELNMQWGYPFAILLMILSSAVTLMLFRKKNWL